KKIERQSGYSFVYRDQLLNKYMTVTIKVKEMPLERVLRLCLKDLPLTYAIIDKTIVINSKQKEDPAKMNGPEPTTVIKGKVLDDNGKPLEGVSVTLKGKSKGVVTNGEGEYSLTVNEKNPVL